MLKTGLRFFWSSSLGVLYRSMDMAYSAHPALKWMCLMGLSISLVCFVLTYYRLQFSQSKNLREALFPEKRSIALAGRLS